MDSDHRLVITSIWLKLLKKARNQRRRQCKDSDSAHALLTLSRLTH